MSEILLRPQRLDSVFNCNSSVHPILPKIKDYNSPLMKNEVSEWIIDCKRIQLVDQGSAKRNITNIRNIHSFFNINIRDDDQQFPSIDNSEIDTDEINKNNVKYKVSQAKPNVKEWKRQKTFDGAPIFRVILLIIYLVISSYV